MAKHDRQSRARHADRRPEGEGDDSEGSEYFLSVDDFAVQTPAGAQHEKRVVGKRMIADFVSLLENAANELTVFAHPFPRHKKSGFCRVRGQQSQEQVGSGRIRAIVKGEGHSLFLPPTVTDDGQKEAYAGEKRSSEAEKEENGQTEGGQVQTERERGKTEHDGRGACLCCRRQSFRLLPNPFHEIKCSQRGPVCPRACIRAMTLTVCGEPDPMIQFIRPRA